MVCRRSSPKPILQSEKCLMRVTLLMTRLIRDKLYVDLACTSKFLTGPCSYLLKWFANNTPSSSVTKRERCRGSEPRSFWNTTNLPWRVSNLFLHHSSPRFITAATPLLHHMSNSYKKVTTVQIAYATIRPDTCISSSWYRFFHESRRQKLSSAAFAWPELDSCMKHYWILEISSWRSMRNTTEEVVRAWRRNRSVVTMPSRKKCVYMAVSTLCF